MDTKTIQSEIVTFSMSEFLNLAKQKGVLNEHLEYDEFMYICQNITPEFYYILYESNFVIRFDFRTITFVLSQHCFKRVSPKPKHRPAAKHKILYDVVSMFCSYVDVKYSNMKLRHQQLTR